MEKKKILSCLLAGLALFSVTSIKANAEWRKDSTGWWYVEGNSYVTGWKCIDEEKYHFDNKGYLKTGWQKDNNNTWYYYYSNGTMAKDTTINGYYLTNNGNMLDGISKEDINKYVKLIEKNLPKDIKVVNLKNTIITSKNFQPSLYNFKLSKVLSFYTFAYSIKESEEYLFDFNIHIDLDTNKVYVMDGGQNLYQCKDGKRLYFKPKDFNR